LFDLNFEFVRSSSVSVKVVVTKQPEEQSHRLGLSSMELDRKEEEETKTQKHRNAKYRNKKTSLQKKKKI
jgi:hypothetical protein